MPKNQQQQPDPGNSFNVLSVFFFLVLGYECCFWAFMRRRFGVRAFSMGGPAAIVVMYLYALAYHCPVEMVCYFAVWMVLVLYHRIEALAWGQQRHSKDNGDTWMANILRPASPFIARAGFEPVILFGIGLTLWINVSQELGNFVMLGGVPICFQNCYEKLLWDQEARNLQDKQYNMRARAGRFDNRS
jgi:hypothetical protein